MPIKLGQRLRFHYPNFGTPEGHPELRAHSGQFVTVVLRMPDWPPDPEQWFLVRADDGAQFEASEYELGRAQFTPHDVKFCGCRRRFKR